MSGAEKSALLEFVRSGRGFVGVHSATDTFYTWPDYLDLIGGYFNGHPWHQSVAIEVVDPGIHWRRSSGSRSKSKTKSIKSATSTIADRTWSCASTQAWSILASRVCINDSTAGLSPGPDFTARGEYSIRHLGTRHQSGRTLATRGYSRTLSFGPCEGRTRATIYSKALQNRIAKNSGSGTSARPRIVPAPQRSSPPQLSCPFSATPFVRGRSSERYTLVYAFASLLMLRAYARIIERP